MADVSRGTDKLTPRDDTVSGEALATPRLRAEREVLGALDPAVRAMRRILDQDMTLLESGAQSAGMRVQAELAMRVIDACLGMAGTGERGTTRKAAQILAAVGGDAVNKELMRRYAAKLRTTERSRIVDAVPAQADAPAPIYKEGADHGVALHHGINDTTQPAQVSVTDAITTDGGSSQDTREG